MTLIQTTCVISQSFIRIQFQSESSLLKLQALFSIDFTNSHSSTKNILTGS